MRLETLVVQGFKSFPEKVTIRFHQGLTAVVGPNGSGKSNISDAMRWVLGEQSSKALRVKNMEDIIFGGTQYKRPQSFAFVELTIDNADRTLACDADQVTVSRKLFRSGDSEYRINGALVRLRDVHELFMDTGLGRDGYAIISQGRIAEIIAAKSVDRRDIFEEAAGIAKFRYRKEEAERRLQQAEDNLVRIRDIERELAERVGPLKVQSEKAKEFLRLAEIRKQQDVSLAVFRYDAYRDTLRELDTKLCISREQYAELESADERLEKVVADQYDRLQRLAAQIDRGRQELHDNEAAIAGSSSEIAVFQNEIFHAEEAVERLGREAAAIGARREYAARERETLRAERERLAAELTACSEKVREAERRIAGNSELLQNYFETSRQLSDKLQQAATAIGEQNYRLAQLEAREEESDRRISDVAEQIEQREFDAEEYAERLTRAEETGRNSRARLEENEQRVRAAQQTLETERERMAAQRRILDELSKQLSAAQQRIAILNDLEKNFEGFYGSVRKVMSAAAAGRLHGVHGTVSELITVDRAQAVAIEVALGSSLQHIVCAREADAKAGIAYLKQGGYGRATFLPLETVRGEALRLPELEQVPGFLGVASTLVQCDRQYEGVVASLLGRVLVCTDLDSASELALRTNRRYRVVTADGQVINAGGSYTGGSLVKNAGLLTRKNEIASWEAQRRRLEQELAEKTGLHDTAQAALEQAEAKLQPRLAALEEDRRALYRQEMETGNLRSQQEACAADIDRWQQEKQSLLQAQTACRSERAALEQTIRQMEDEQLSIFERMSQENARTADLRADSEALISEKNTLALKEVSLRKDLERAEEQTAACEGRIEEADQNALDTAAQIEAARRKIEQLNQKICETSARSARLTAANARQDETIATLNAARIEIEQAISAARSEQKSQGADRERLSVEITRLTERHDAAAAEQETVLARIWEEYELSKSQALALAEPVEDAAALNLELGKTKSAIRALGQVNVAAIEEYETVNGRYLFMQEQIADIEKSRNELTGIIGELEKNMQSMFLASFGRINTAFSGLFAQFFGGGRAYLELSDPDNVLASGIDIYVQPPGKIIKNLASLSGGEQAFVAIALYFAIQTERPSPFCLLDEIESALDDVNVAKFARYLRTLEHMQVVAITHRRGTMEEADVLYGVTTQQDGVSRVLTLDLHTAVKTAEQG